MMIMFQKRPAVVPIDFSAMTTTSLEPHVATNWFKNDRGRSYYNNKNILRARVSINVSMAGRKSVDPSTRLKYSNNPCERDHFVV